MLDVKNIKMNFIGIQIIIKTESLKKIKEKEIIFINEIIFMFKNIFYFSLKFNFL